MLNKLRGKIDEIDEKILGLLNERAKRVVKIILWLLIFLKERRRW